MKRRMFFGLMASNVAWASGLDRLHGPGNPESGAQAFVGEFSIYLNHDLKHDGHSMPGTGSARALVRVAGDVVHIAANVARDEADGEARREAALDDFAKEKLNPVVVGRLLFPCDFLSRCMSWGELTTEQDDVLDGQAVRRASFALDKNWQRDRSGKLGGEYTLHIWTGPQDLPLQAVETERRWARQREFEVTRTTAIRYAMSGQRLIATRLEEREFYKSTGTVRNNVEVLTLVASG